MHKKAYQHIWLTFLQFSTVFNETLSKCFFFQGRLNETFKSKLTLLLFSQIARGDQRKKTKKQKKAEKVQPNVLIGLFVHFPFHKARISLAETANRPESGQFQFQSEPSEISNLRSSNSPKNSISSVTIQTKSKLVFSYLTG